MGIDRDGGAVHTGWSFREGLLEKVGSEQRPEGGATRMCDDRGRCKGPGVGRHTGVACGQSRGSMGEGGRR